MKQLFASIAMLVACSQPPSDAAVPSVVTWTDPTNRISISYSETDWSVQPSRQSRPADIIMQLEPLNHEVLGNCEISRVSQPLAGVTTRAAMNQATANLPQTMRMDLYQSEGGTLDHVATADIGGITVLDVHSSRPRLQLFERRFFLQSPRTLDLYKLSCANAPVDEAAHAAVAAVAATLAVHD